MSEVISPTMNFGNLYVNITQCDKLDSEWALKEERFKLCANFGSATHRYETLGKVYT